MNKILRVAATEYIVAVRSKAFLIGLLIMPVMIAMSFLFQKLANERKDVGDKVLAIVDREGSFFDVIQRAAERRNRDAIFKTDANGERKQTESKFVLRFHEGTEDDLELALSDRVRDKEFFAFVIIGEDVVSSDEGAAVSYHTRNPTYDPLPDWLRFVINEDVKRRRFIEAQVDAALVAKLNRAVAFQRLGLAERTASGEVKKGERDNKLKTFVVPMAALFLAYLIVMTAAPTLLNNVLEEKMQKIAEVLISTVSPFQLMMGKLMAAVLVAMTLSAIYVGGAAFLLWKQRMLGLVPAPAYFWFFLFQFIALTTFGAICSAIGAACAEIKDAQNLMGPVIILAVFPLVAAAPIIQDPNSGIARALTFFPPATPMLMLLRILVPPGVPGWEIALGLAVSVIFMIGCVYASAKIFRVGILSQGQTPSPRRLLAWIAAK